MSRDFPEADWKLFRKLTEIALQRFCEAVLAEVQETTLDTAKSAHERYLALYRLIERRDRELGEAFNNPRRSTAMMQLAAIHSRGLLEPEEVSRFSASTRETLSFLVGDGARSAAPPSKPVQTDRATRGG